ncbi:MAG: hypothetical protein QOD69_3332 [Solirubrobacteraceae bacterium]|nr:hypothetical protein [Solirubrobacteraceae bacterium]
MRAAAALLACVALGGCGGGGAKAPARPAPAGGQITIEEPADGQSLRGRAATGGGLRLRARARGTGRPGSTVFLSASCQPRPCTTRADVGADGRWSARIELNVPLSGRFVTIDANAQEQLAASGSAVATVELVSDERARRAIRDDAAKAGRTPRRRAPASVGPGAGAAPSRPTLAHDVLVIGDSLAVGMAGALAAALPGWHVSVDARTSRPLREGLRILGTQPQAPAILAFSLFTNDDPGSTSALEAAVRATATRPGGCAVWATIAAPPVRGVDYGTANQLLRGLASDPALALSLQVVDWGAAVAASPSELAGDGVHATTAGYTKRARLDAAAIRAGAGG